jgi:hypothetical protein
MKSCNLPLPPVKKATVLRRLVQRYSPLAIANATVRFDVTHGMWALLDANENVKQHFEIAVMKDVKFTTKTVNRYVGCAGVETTHAGFAAGDLFLHKNTSRTDGLNMSFRDGKFLDVFGNPLNGASEIALFNNRRAIYFQ